LRAANPGAEVVAVVSALIDGFDLIVAVRGVQPQLARRLAGRVRNRGAVLIAAGAWPGVDLELRVSNRKWCGLTEDGFGHLEYQDVVATSRGRGAATRPQTVALQPPGPGGAAAAGRPLAPARLDRGPPDEPFGPAVRRGQRHVAR
jgi:hypothetical protein